MWIPKVSYLERSFQEITRVLAKVALRVVYLVEPTHVSSLSLHQHILSIFQILTSRFKYFSLCHWLFNFECSSIYVPWVILTKWPKKCALLTGMIGWMKGQVFTTSLIFRVPGDGMVAPSFKTVLWLVQHSSTFANFSWGEIY